MSVINGSGKGPKAVEQKGVNEVVDAQKAAKAPEAAKVAKTFGERILEISGRDFTTFCKEAARAKNLEGARLEQFMQYMQNLGGSPMDSEIALATGIDLKSMFEKATKGKIG